MSRKSLIVRAPLMTVASALVATAYGITFPLISIRLEATGVSGTWIGLNAAMPAVGWIIGSALLPLLQVGLGIPFKRLLQLFLLIAIVALFSMRYAESYQSMTALRLLFGGGIGVMLRCIEFWINDVSDNQDRGRNLGIYNILFMIALILGSAVQPVLGITGWTAFAPPLLLMATGLILFQAWSGNPAPVIDTALPPAVMGIVLSIPLALLAVLAYGIYESLPTTMLQVYALRNSVDATTAAHTLTAAALGNLLSQYPITALSDRIGRIVPLLVCASVVVLASALLPFTLVDSAGLLATVAVLGGAAGASYSLALAMVGDRYQGSQLVVANAAFGIIYASGAIAGPIINGLAIDQLDTHGLVVVLAAVFAILATVTALSSVRPARRAQS